MSLSALRPGRSVEPAQIVKSTGMRTQRPEFYERCFGAERRVIEPPVISLSQRTPASRIRKPSARMDLAGS